MGISLFPNAYLLVSDVIALSLSLFACKFQVSLFFLSRLTLIHMLIRCNNAFCTINEVDSKAMNKKKAHIPALSLPCSGAGGWNREGGSE